MLRIGKLTDYATIIMTHLALSPGRVLSAAEVAEAVHLSVPTVSKLLKILAEFKLVCSLRGAEGGYKLAKPASEITLSDIVTAIEGNVAMTECCNHNNSCTLDALCHLKENWRTINNVILATLKNFTLTDLTRPLNLTTFRGVPIHLQA
ncbi:hypothetical protein AYO45_05420 [Gammaproteobacteria bacterium SCGC AG-212-F23]|nr:hypothetical protein AYO45_05420 [Gammaproteobacteria bacterium SCGC AG-212-F23]